MKHSEPTQASMARVLVVKARKKQRRMRFFTIVALVFLLGCSVCCGGGGHSDNTGNSSGRLVNAATPLVTPTYDGSGQGMHPGIVSFASDWHGYRYWMSMTPYPNNDDKLENPSLLASHDGLQWEVPVGLTNPVAPYQPYHQMDPDLLYDADSGQLWLYYLRGNDQAKLLRRTSSDGVHWSDEQLQFAIPYNTIASPAVDKVDGTYKLWSVNLAGVGCSAPQTQVELRSSTDGANWSAPVSVELHQPGFEVWHIEVAWIAAKNEYWAMYAAYPDGSNCGTTSLYFAKSADGVNWTTFAHPALKPGSGDDWDASQIYRSTFLYEPSTDMLKVWYSAQRGQVWHTGFTEAKYSDFLKELSQ